MKNSKFIFIGGMIYAAMLLAGLAWLYTVDTGNLFATSFKLWLAVLFAGGLAAYLGWLVLEDYLWGLVFGKLLKRAWPQRFSSEKYAKAAIIEKKIAIVGVTLLAVGIASLTYLFF